MTFGFFYLKKKLSMKQDRDDIEFKLKELRRKLKINQEALAHKLGVSFISVK